MSRPCLGAGPFCTADCWGYGARSGAKDRPRFELVGTTLFDAHKSAVNVVARSAVSIPAVASSLRRAGPIAPTARPSAGIGREAVARTNERDAAMSKLDRSEVYAGNLRLTRDENSRRFAGELRPGAVVMYTGKALRATGRGISA